MTQIPTGPPQAPKGPPDQRREELAVNLAQLRDRIAAGCAAAGRDPATVRLVAVTKTYPASDVLHLAALGVGDIGENRDQEAAPKAASVRAAGVEVRWHFVGHLQRNKCRSVVGYADVVHSVDRVRLVQALDAAAVRVRHRPLDVLVQVSLDGDTARGGALVSGSASPTMPDGHTAGDGPPGDHLLDPIADAVAGSSMLRLAGVMAVAPLDWPPDRAFAELAGVAADLRRRYPQAVEISAGMSHDLEPALAHGATLVRIGTALLGKRPALR